MPAQKPNPDVSPKKTANAVPERVHPKRSSILPSSSSSKSIRPARVTTPAPMPVAATSATPEHLNTEELDLLANQSSEFDESLFDGFDEPIDKASKSSEPTLDKNEKPPLLSNTEDEPVFTKEELDNAAIPAVVATTAAATATATSGDDLLARYLKELEKETHQANLDKANLKEAELDDEIVFDEINDEVEVSDIDPDLDTSTKADADIPSFDEIIALQTGPIPQVEPRSAKPKSFAGPAIATVATGAALVDAANLATDEKSKVAATTATTTASAAASPLPSRSARKKTQPPADKKTKEKKPKGNKRFSTGQTVLASVIAFLLAGSLAYVFFPRGEEVNIAEVDPDGQNLITALEEQNADLLNELNISREQHTTTDEMLKEAEKALADAGIELTEAQKSEQAAREEREQLQAQRDNTPDNTGRLAALEQAANTANASKAQLQRDLTASQSQVTSLNTQLATAKSNEQSAKAKLSVAESNLSKTQGDLAKSRQETAAKQTQLDAANASLTKAQKDLQNSRSEVASLTTQLTNANAKLTKTQNELATAQSNLTSAQNEIKTLNNRIAELEAQIEAGKPTP